MRVTRRIRPSQVGCGATIGRRRLYAASLFKDETAAEAPPVARMAFVIQPDGRIHALPLSDDAEGGRVSPSELFAASASGR